MLKRNRLFILAFAIVLLPGLLGVRLLSAKETATDERDRARNAATVLSEIMQMPETGIPNDLMSRAEAVAVIPHVVKGAFGVGGEYGKGLVSHRLDNGRWSPPSFITIGGGSFGLQLGVEATDLVLIFTSRDGFKGLLDGKVKLGVDAAVGAGPVGRNAEVSSDVLLRSPVFAYSRSKGLFAGISLEGAVVTIDNAANNKVYGKEVSAEDILYNGKARINPVVAPFVRALEKYSPARKRITD
jgi:lipid-binding SYLF domain-containing protein